jgi:hypothetical protein
VKQAISEERTIAVLDAWPGRVASGVYNRFAASVKNGLHLASPPPCNPGPDLRRVRTLVSFGVPVLEDWGPPNLLLRRRGEVHVIYVGTRFSLTCDMADRWVPYMTDELIEELKQGAPAVAVGSTYEAAKLNQLLGDKVALVHRREMSPAPRSISGVPDRSIGLLIAETPSVPFEVVKPKLASGAVVIAFAAWPNDYTSNAQHVLPAAAPFETEEDVPASFDAPAASFRLTPALMPSKVLTLAGFLAQVMPSLGTLEENRIARIAAIHKERKGTVDGKPVAGMSLEDFTSALREGAAWVDEEYRSGAVGFPLSPGSRRLLAPEPLLARRIA